MVGSVSQRFLVPRLQLRVPSSFALNLNDLQEDDASNDLLSRMQVDCASFTRNTHFSSYTVALTVACVCSTQRIGASVPFPGAAVNDDMQASNQRADEEAAALAKAAADAERKVSEAY